jgi:hypothetical protein
MNYFILANTILCFSGGIWYVTNGQVQLGLLQFTFTVSNIIFLTMGK